MPPGAADLRGWHTLEVFQHGRDDRVGGTGTPVTRHSQEWDAEVRGGTSVRTDCKGTRLLDGTSHGTFATCTQHRLGLHHRAAPDGSWARPDLVCIRGPAGGVDVRQPWARGRSVQGWHRTIPILHARPQHSLVPLPCLVRRLPRVGTRPCSLPALGSA